MKFLYILTTILFLSSSLLAYSDQDIDGVEDTKDLCPNTPFDILVDENGCPYDKNIMGAFLFQIGNDISFDTISDRTHNLTLFFNYTYKNWDFSLSSANYDTANFPNISDAEDDLFVTVGYLFQYEKLSTKFSLGTKFAFMDEKSNHRDNDYFSSINLDYFVNQKQNIFLYYTYTLSGDSDTTSYKNFYTYSLGSGYAINDKWYSALSYNYASSAYPGAKSYKALSWFNYYTLPHNYYISSYYARTLNSSTYDHLLSFNIGVRF